MRSNHVRPIGVLVGVTALSACCLAGPTPAAHGASNPAPPPITGSTSALVGERGSQEQASKAAARRYSKQLAHRMNVVRRHHDLRPLRVVDCLDRFAGSWARQLARSGQFYHQDLSPIMARCNLSSAGEIIAKGSVSPRQMIRMWLDSPGHRTLLLEPSFRIAGVAGRHGHGAWVGCIDFGRR